MWKSPNTIYAAENRLFLAVDEFCVNWSEICFEFGQWRWTPDPSIQGNLTMSATVVAPAPTKALNSTADRSGEYPWIGGRVPNGFWDCRENRMRYLDWLGRECGFSKPEDWYQCRKHHFQRYRGGGLLRNQYGCSVVAALRDYMPEVEWLPWLFGGAPNGFWGVRENRTHYMQWLGRQLGIKTPEGWYDVTGADFFLHHGGGLLNNQFNGSVQRVLQDFLPTMEWQAWRFASVPQSYWRKAENRAVYMSWLGDKLGFETKADWSNLKREHFYRHNGSGLFVTHYRGSTRRAIADFFDESKKK